jgi:KAP family P-loop domain/Caspase domain
VTLVVDREVDGPATHALVIGIDSYPYLVGGSNSGAGGELGELASLGQLTAPAPSAQAFASWLRDSFRSAGAPLGSVELLLSPRDPSGSSEIVEGEPEPPQRSNVLRAFDRWAERCRQQAGNAAIFYFCGHACRSGTHETVLLLEDFGAHPSRPFENAINLDGTQLGMASWDVAKWFFIDASRAVVRQGSARLATTLVETRPDIPPSRASTVTVFSARAGEQAFAQTGGELTFFTRALLRGLDGRAAVSEDGRWVVRADSLVAAVQEDLNRLETDYGLRQSIEVSISGPARVILLDREAPPPIEPLDQQQLDEALASAQVSVGHVTYPGYVSDRRAGQELLGRSDDIRAMARLLAARSTEPPLSVGLFGDWGSGKTFFIDRLQSEIATLADASRAASDRGQPTEMCAEVHQIVFNAWHYVDANLWASLVAAIFQQLAAPQRNESEEEARKRWSEQRERLMKELESAKEQLDEARERHSAALTEYTRIQEELDRLRVRHADERRRLTTLLPVAKLILQRQDVTSALNKATKELGRDESPVKLEQLRQFSSDASLGWQRVSRIWRLLSDDRRRGLRMGLLISTAVAAVLAVALPLALETIAQGVVQAFAGIIGLLAPLITAGATVLAKLNGALNVVEDAAETVAEAEREQHERRSQEERAVLADLERIDAQQAVLGQEALRAEQRVEDAATKLEEAQAGRQLARFIQERSASADYREQLGIIAMIRRDFDHLVTLIEQSRSEEHAGDDTTLPQVERIILYVDDLDRCPPDRVVDVLQAVHLLLALRLFIVVVAVDPRWLLRSLEHHFEEVLGTPSVEPGRAMDDSAHWASTPMNYLEKVFQIPYTLPPMDKQGFERLVSELLPPEQATSSESGVRQVSSNDADRQEPMTATRQPNGDSGEATTAGQVDEQTATPDGAAEDSSDSESTMPLASPLPDLTPRALILDGVERRFASQLASLIPTPRAAKRLANLYRFIRASLNEDDLQTLVPSGAYQVVLTLLAILVGFPSQAADVFQGILGRGDGDSWWTFVRGLYPDTEPGLEKRQPQQRSAVRRMSPDRIRNLVVEEMSSVEVLRWQRLTSALLTLEPHLKLPDRLEPFKEWIPSVARFSFHTGRLVALHESKVSMSGSGPPGSSSNDSID